MARGDLLGRPAEIFGPVAYAPHWLWIGLALAAASIVWPAAWWLGTRPRKERPVTDIVATRTPADALAEARQGVDRVRRAHAAGEASDRAAHQELSRVVRRFLAQVSGWPVDHMGLADLRSAMARDGRLAELTDYVAVLHPSAFGLDGTGDVLAAAARADELVALWASAVQGGPRADQGAAR